jgi:hypothetical protein
MRWCEPGISFAAEGLAHQQHIWDVSSLNLDRELVYATAHWDCFSTATFV